jgi:hypothetical protein
LAATARLCRLHLLATAQPTALQQQLCTATQMALVMRLAPLTHLVLRFSPHMRRLLHRHLQRVMA